MADEAEIGTLKDESQLPRVSVITAVRNGADAIIHTLDSVAMQVGVSVEHLVIDGGSNDTTLDILMGYRNPNLIWISERDEGIYDAMNKGVERARGEWLLFLGADDVLAGPKVLEAILGRNDVSGYDVICGVSRFDDQRLYVSKLDWRINVFNTIHHQAALYRRTLFNGFRYRTDIPIFADYELNYKIRRMPNKVCFVGHEVAVCGSRGQSYFANRWTMLLSLFRVRSPYINRFLNLLLFMVGVGNLVVSKIKRSPT